MQFSISVEQHGSGLKKSSLIVGRNVSSLPGIVLQQMPYPCYIEDRYKKVHNLYAWFFIFRNFIFTFV
jgi:hypothetical protein